MDEASNEQQKQNERNTMNTSTTNKLANKVALVTGGPLKAFPDWFIKGQPRPSHGRHAFTTWNYFTKDSLPFYTSPLENEVNAYFLWRKSWLQPGITASYGWGSKTEYEERIRYIKLLRLRKRGSILIDRQTTEEIADFSLAASLRHSFYWMHVLGEKDYVKFTPQFVFSAGTQKFGFNRTTSAYAVNTRLASYLLYNSGDITIDDKL